MTQDHAIERKELGTLLIFCRCISGMTRILSCTKSLSEQEDCSNSNLLPILGRTLKSEIPEPSLVTASLAAVSRIYSYASA